jgi:hypothetical protein
MSMVAEDHSLDTGSACDDACVGARAAGVGLLAILGAMVVTVAAMLNPAVGHADSGLILGATGTPEPSPDYIERAAKYYLDPTTSCKIATCSLSPVFTPEQFWPVPGWGDLSYDQSVATGADDLHAAILAKLAESPTDPVVVYATSQSASVVTIEKRRLADLPQAEKNRVVFVVTGNPNRPNGGLMERFAPLSVPVMDFTFDGPTPTNTRIQTYDIVFEYDVPGDFPRYPLNVFTILNMAAAEAIHSSYLTTRDGYTEDELQQAINDPANRQTYGDTTYITIPAKHLPLADAIRAWGDSTGWRRLTTPLADLLEPTLRVLVDLGYDRTTPYGKPAPIGLFAPIQPVKLAAALSQAAWEGVRAATADLRADPPRPGTLHVAGQTTGTSPRPASHVPAPRTGPSAGAAHAHRAAVGGSQRSGVSR